MKEGLTGREGRGKGGREGDKEELEQWLEGGGKGRRREGGRVDGKG